MVTSKPKTVIITGANGFLGSTLVKYFKKEGWQIIALVRNAKKSKLAGVKYVEYNLSLPFDTSVFKGADYLVHTAYVKYDKEHPDALRINVTGTERLLKASRQHKLKRNLFISSMLAYPGVESVYGKQKLAVEKLFKGKDCTVIRSGPIIGNGGMTKQMTDFMKSKHAVPLVGGGRQPIQVIGVYDLVQAIKIILTKNHSGTFTVATPRVYSYKEFYKALQKHLGTWVIFVPIPLAALMGMVKLTRLLHLPVSLSEESVLGLKSLHSAETTEDLRALNLKLDDLDKVLSKSDI